MKRIVLSAVFAVLALDLAAPVANALPANTPIFRACVQRYADSFLYGNESLFGESSMLDAINQAIERCLGADLR